ncbi:efflux RND transporter periplasmic adaptor subunit [Reyranella sp. CPCC 100927]|uniref:efflux RND transporter periplasmic adaptor subunit n=1 Tax=Reyranella sp. CPCC 100927 TaxID=2599616 RepID=UPI0011B69491|nr:efflux RND transporter periplasmic adaptor subunit [Reyranella sp. CPCC 100927]TWT09675.1 efflux RND transporter periplasmic adaptor subunit [Reyranella sp. CPCC 100927]
MSSGSDAPRGALRHLRSIAAAIVLVGAVLGGIYGWRQERRAAAATSYPAHPIEVVAQAVTPETLPQFLEAIGSLQSVQEVMLSAEVSGRIVSIRFEAGSTVASGAPLLQLYDAPERADRAAAAARLQLADLQYKRAAALSATGADSRARLDQADAELAQSRAAIDQLDSRIAQKQIKAPFPGQIGLRRVNLGQYVNAGDPVATLTNLDRLYVNFTLPQQELARLRVGGTVTVSADPFPSQTFQARINAIEPKIGEGTRNVTVQAVIDNEGHRLRPGMYVTARVALPPRDNAMVVPLTAIMASASGDSVVVVRHAEGRSGGGTADVVPVVTGQRIGDRIVVERGLKDGDVIVTRGQLRVRPGAAVTVKPGETASLPPAVQP